VETLIELFEQARAAQAQDASPKLAPDRHPNRDFFIADILDWALKDDRHTMEHPMFSLAKKPDKRVRRYEHNGISVTITPSVLGIATIWDKDVLIYAISQLVEGLNRGQPTSRIVRLKAYDLLVATNRHTGGMNYDRLVDSLRRLKGTQIETDIVTGGHRERRGFGLLEEWRIVEKSPTSDRMVAIELTLSEWLYRAVCAREVLTLSADYFRLDGGLERRLYELARKHCGYQRSWTVGLELLRKKSGSAAASLRKFRQLVKNTAENNFLPEYAILYQADSDQITFTRRESIGRSGTLEP
jgi:plasmid replication initiation protein